MQSYFRILLLVIPFLTACISQNPRLYAHPDDLYGEQVDSGEQIDFREVQSNGLMINFYSPICVPCIEELPALELIYNKLQQQNTATFIAVYAELLDPLLEQRLTEHSEKFAQIIHDQKIEILRKDREKYNISLPIILLNRKIPIADKQGSLMISATPETILYSGSVGARRLHYSFVGPISLKKSKAAIQDDPRFQFVNQKIIEMGLNTTKNLY